MVPHDGDWDADAAPSWPSELPPDAAPYKGGDISGQHCRVREAYRRWLGDSYDLGALDVVLCAAAAEKLPGDPPWVQMVGGSGAAKTETLMPLRAAGAHVISMISGEAALLSGTSKRDRAKHATGGLLRTVGPAGLVVIKDFTSILSMNRDTRALVLSALREIHDGRWSRTIGGEGGQELVWEGRLVIIGACTTAWDAAHQVVATMGDRFVLVRLAAGRDGRRRAGVQAMLNAGHERLMRKELSTAVGDLLGTIPADAARITLTEAEIADVLAAADLVTRARTAVERDFNGTPAWAHALEMPTRLAKQLVQLARGGLALGMTRAEAMAVAARTAADTMPPLRLQVLINVAAHPDSATSDVVRAVQLPRNTVDRTLQELHLLGLLEVDAAEYGQRTRWMYSLAEHVDRATLEMLSRNVTTRIGSAR